jgi:UDP-N-acetylglucosamine--N-acetylmuramyl-(pentapeptide) pyrophosphoryl-undecaprenol N-acetylglucosamine transferase
MSDSLRVMLTGGGTGGHVYPALSVVEDAVRRGISAEFCFVGTSGGLERDIVRMSDVPFFSVRAGAVRGRSPTALLASAIGNGRGLIEASRLIRTIRPDVVLATGGFVCVPVVLAARLAGVPSVVYLPDLRPGLAVRFLSRLVDAVAVSFDEVLPLISSRRVVVTGYPVRADLASWSPQTARASLGLPADLPVVLIIGGSRGARSINEAIVDGATRLVEKAVVVHSTGVPHFNALRQRLTASLPPDQHDRYRMFPYLGTEFAPALAASTIVVSRAGASTLGELPAVGAVGVLVPYPHAGAHQRLNAEFLDRHGAAVTVDDAGAIAGRLVDTILELLGDSTRRSTMSSAARRLAQPQASAKLFDLLQDVSRRGGARVRGGSIA